MNGMCLRFLTPPSHSFAPPSHAFAHSSLIHGESPGGVNNPRTSPSTYNQSTQGGALNYAGAGFSVDMRGLLNGSIVDPYASQQSFTGSLVPIDDATTSILDIRADQQYALLDRFHSERGLPDDRQYSYGRS